MTNELVSTDKYYLVVYENGDEVGQAIASSVKGGETRAIQQVEYIKTWAKAQVWYSKPGDVFLVLKTDDDICKVLHNNRVGWICCGKSIGLKKVKP